MARTTRRITSPASAALLPAGSDDCGPLTAQVGVVSAGAVASATSQRSVLPDVSAPAPN
ncbi:MAG: hypothetical protein JO132_11315 [Streptosporangiaceae bacterium]|nr:hypothetical protein [Streptosporangiaceae bacterium]